MIDPCEGNICENGAECRKSLSNKYACDCKDGFSGQYCEEIYGGYLF